MTGSDARSWANLSDEELLALSDAEFDSLTGDVADLLLEGPIEIEPEQPSASLWAAIAAQLEVDLAIDRDRPLTPVQPLERRRSGTDTAASKPAFRASSRWSGRTAALTLIAAAVLLIAVPLGLSLRSRDNDPEILAAADLEVLDPAATFGHADLVAESGGEAIALDYEATAPTDEYLELWLLAVDDDGGVEDLRSLGRVEGDGPYELPADIDRDRFNVVDISIEADDGDATHSGHSILRGQLTS
ncbi:MAG: anti-sigma factor [Acidimicrobiales bacterium]